MKKNFKYILGTALLSMAVLGGKAQTLTSSYFLEGSLHRHMLNPAFMSERNYVSMIGLGNVNVQLNGNVGLSDFVYKYNDPNGKYDYTTFMSSTVKASQFLNKLHSNNKFAASVDITLLAGGFYAWGGFNTVSIGMHSNNHSNMPKELFKFMKSGQTAAEGTNYTIKNFKAYSDSYLDISFGHARQINDQLDLGAKVKFLLGLANMNAKMNQIDVKMSGTEWIVKTDGSVDLAGKDFSFKHYEDRADGTQVKGVDYDGGGLAGFGVGVDLGASYKMLDNQLILSASVLDLGFISWNKNIVAKDNGTAYKFTGFTDFVLDAEKDDENSLENQFDKMENELYDAIRLYDQGSKSRTTGLRATLNFAGEYNMPFYDKLSAGLMSTTRIIKNYTTTEARLFANCAPLSWLDGSVNVGASTYGAVFGAMINFHPKGFNFFIGTDAFLGKVNKQFIPLYNTNMSVSMGINFPFGELKNE